MAFEGMDVDQVRSLAKQMNSTADQIDGLMKKLTGQLQSTNWKGPDHDRFNSDWQSQHCRQLNQVVAGLRDAARGAERNANEQESASSR